MEFIRTRPGRKTSACSLLVAICTFCAFLRVAQLLLEGCLELQPELGVTTCWISGLRVGRSVDIWIVHSVIGHHMTCFGPMDFI